LLSTFCLSLVFIIVVPLQLFVFWHVRQTLHHTACRLMHTEWQSYSSEHSTSLDLRNKRGHNVSQSPSCCVVTWVSSGSIICTQWNHHRCQLSVSLCYEIVSLSFVRKLTEICLIKGQILYGLEKIVRCWNIMSKLLFPCQHRNLHFEHTIKDKMLIVGDSSVKAVDVNEIFHDRHAFIFLSVYD